jgi:hypothetical protein
VTSIPIVPLLCYYEIKDVKINTFKLKHEDYEEKETFDVEESDSMTMQMLFYIDLSFQTMSTRIGFTGLLMFTYTGMCFTDNALEEWQIVPLHQKIQTIENIEDSQEEWLTF